MPATKLKAFLDANHVKYSVLSHSTAYTAPEIAFLAHIRGKELAKTVIVELDGRIAMAVLPSSQHVDFARLRVTTGAKAVTLVPEEQFKGMFPGCETGAMPPFGNLYGIPVFVDEGLSEDKEIWFNAGTHSELVHMSYADFARLVEPTVIGFAAKAA